MIDDYWLMGQTMPGNLIGTSNSVEYYTGLTSGEPEYSPDYPKDSPNINGDITWGSEVDGNFVRLVSSSAYCVWDLGADFSEIVVFPYVDGSSLREGLDFWVWGSNDFDICNPNAATWTEADLERIYRKGWSDAGENKYTICNDDFVSVWDWKCDNYSDAGYRFIKIQAACISGFNDSEIDAVKGVSPGLCDWQTTILERGRTFSYTSLAISDDGKMHIAYGDEQLYYIVCDGVCEGNIYRCVGETCQKEEIDSGGVGAYCSLALDNWDNPGISYYDTMKGALKYAHWNGTKWKVETVEGGVCDVGRYTSLAFDCSGNPAISYYDATNDNLKYARRDKNGWVIEAVDSQGWVGMYTSLAFDSACNPAISYYDATNDNLKYAKWNGIKWGIETVDSQGDVGQHTSLAFDSLSNPAISYHDATNGDLKYALKKGASWDIAIVDSSDYTGFYTSLVFDGSDYPAISYYDPTKSDLKYTKCNGTTWDIMTVDSLGDVGLYTSLALGCSGNPVISYYDNSNDILKYAQWEGTEWDIESFCSLGDVGRYTSLAFDSQGNPAISYYDLRFGDLKYAHWTDSNCTNCMNFMKWEVETVDGDGDVGRYTSLAFNSSGNPAISYYDVSEGNLKYAQWNGTSWDIKTVDSPSDVGSYSSLAFDPSSGNPAIAYYDASHNDLKYAQWNGTSWDIERLDSLGDVGSYTSLAFNTSGNGTISTAISYYDATNGDLKYAYRCYSSSWEIDTIDSSVNSVNDVGSYTSLAFDSSGNPAISYHDATNGDLRYAQWNGASWVIETVDDGDWVGMYTSLAFDASGDCCDTAGNPAISYYDSTNGDLKYARWNGNEWEIKKIDSVGLAGRYSSLAFHPYGSPAISYDEAIHDELRYVQIPPECGPCQPPNQPVNIFPSNGGIIDLTPTLSSSIFSTPNEEAVYAASQWQVYTMSNDCSSPIFDSGIDTSNKTSITITSTELSQNTIYYWRIRHQDSCGLWSRWSAETSFTIHPLPYQPSNISPADGAYTSLTPTLTSSEFLNPDDDPHSASQWQVTTVAGEYSNPIFDSGTDTIKLESIRIPSGILNYETNYYWRVRHQDTHDAWSSWSAETSFTPTQLTGINSINPRLGNQGQILDVTIAGVNFGGATAISLGSFVTVHSFSVDSDTQITASITISDLATLGARDVAVTAPSGDASLAEGFSVQGMTADVPAGSDVIVTLGDTNVIFETVTVEGTITLTNLIYNPGGELPADVVGFIMDITTTAIYNGPVTLAINYDESGISSESDLRLYHWNGTGWENVTTSVDTNNNIIHGEVAALSPFFVGKPAVSPASSASDSNVIIYIVIFIVIILVLFAGISAYFVTRHRAKFSHAFSALIGSVTRLGQG